ncbi:ran guanine nucleotide release factor-like protein, partial [Trifolium pratense]
MDTRPDPLIPEVHGPVNLLWDRCAYIVELWGVLVGCTGLVSWLLAGRALCGLLGISPSCCNYEFSVKVAANNTQSPSAVDSQVCIADNFYNSIVRVFDLYSENFCRFPFFLSARVALPPHTPSLTGKASTSDHHLSLSLSLSIRPKSSFTRKSSRRHWPPPPHKSFLYLLSLLSLTLSSLCDRQEVFVDPSRDESLIVELLEYKPDIADNGSATWFLQDLASEQDAEGTVVIEQSGVFEAPGLMYNNIPAVVTTAVGQMAISKGRQGREAQNIVEVYLANLRIKGVDTDVLITAYEPIVI